MNATTTIASISTNKILQPPPTMDPIMYFATIVQCGICSAGLVLNGFLIFVIARNRELHASPCSIFILMLATYDWINEFSLATLPTILTVTGISIPLMTCFYFGSYGSYIFYNMTIMMFTISVDRLSSILIPLKYKIWTHRHKWKYVLTAIFGPAFGLIPMSLYLYYLHCASDPEKQVYCMPSDMMGQLGLDFGFAINVYVNAGTFVVYLCIWICIKFKVAKISQDDKIDNRIFKSLFVLMAITLFICLPSPAFVKFVLPEIQMNKTAKDVVYRCVLQLSKMTQAINGPVLYFCSHDYRAAMRKELAKAFGWMSQQNSTQSQTQNIQSISYPNNFTASRIRSRSRAFVFAVRTQQN